jgi:flagellar protein FlbD
MIHLTRLNREPVVVNADLIALLETHPDTVLKLSTGEFVRVLESAEEVVNRVVAYRRRIAGLELEATSPEQEPFYAFR